MISASDRRRAVALITQAQSDGASLKQACSALHVSVRTYQRWRKKKTDARPGAKRRPPSNKLTEEERESMLTLCNKPAYQSLPPTQIVPALADQGRYIASESSFYRVLREADQLQHRGDVCQGSCPLSLSRYC